MLARGGKRTRSPSSSSPLNEKSKKGEKECAVCSEEEDSIVFTTKCPKRCDSLNSGIESAVTVVHYPSSLPFPTKLDSSFPEEPYESRHNSIKSAIHWGQRKLILSEIQFFSQCAIPQVSYHVVYVGAAPGTHIPFLAKLLECKHSWELFDPGEFDLRALQGSGDTERLHITVKNEFFSNETAYNINTRRLRETFSALSVLYQYETTTKNANEKNLAIQNELKRQLGSATVARCTKTIPSMYEPLLKLPYGLEMLCFSAMQSSKPLLFISDIRTGNLKLPNYEDHVAENMRAQESWTRILQANFSLLKFRLPYTTIAKKFGGKEIVPQEGLIEADGTVQYLRGDILLPIWTRPTSTEGRLIVPQCALQVPYNVKKVEDQFFFFNRRVREQMHFNNMLAFDSNLDHHFDSSAEIHCLSTFLQWLHPNRFEALSVEDQKSSIKEVSENISKHLGMNFSDAIRRRDALMLNLARDGGNTENENVEQTSSDEKQENIDYRKCEVDTMKTSVARNDSLTKNENSNSITKGRTGSSPQWKRNEDKKTKRYSHEIKMIRWAGKERNRPLWSVNINEEKFCDPSGLWLTTTMPQ